ncbi:hypothetical protein ACOSQ2_021939 [Xanthoceras sorbifolium]
MDENMVEPDQNGASIPAPASDLEPLEVNHKNKPQPHVVNKPSGGCCGGSNRLFGRERPLHIVLGGGNTANILLWRNKQISGGIFAGGTIIWLLFECIGYHLITLVCHSLILSLSGLFLWSNLAAFSNLSPPEFPEIKLPEDMFLKIALMLRNEFNWACKTFKEIAFGQDIKKFLLVALVLWIVSIVGNWFNFLTLLYFLFVIVLTLPALYERNEDMVDIYGAKALVELKKHYKVVDEMVLQKLPISSFQKKHQ